MRASCYEIDETAQFREIDLEVGFDRWRRREGPFCVELDQIVELKHRILELDRTIDEQVAVFDLLGSMQTPQLDLVRLATYFTVAKGNIAAADRGMDRLDRQAVDLQRVYDAFLQNRTNRRLGRLTVISAIFLPLTLIAGIYGMNFDVMPELGFPYAYPLTLGAMLVLGIGAYFWFRSRGWMD